MLPSLPVLIVGAGPTGLVLALRLARHGVPFRIIDKKTGPGLASRAMAVHARTLEFYQQLGCADAVVDRGIQIETVHWRESHREIAAVQFKNMGQGLSPFPFVLAFPQDDHETFLVGQLQAQGIEVEWGTQLDSFAQDDGGVDVVLDHGGSTTAARVDYLCGCDGVRSRVREGLGVGFTGGTYENLYYVADVKLAETLGTDAYLNFARDDFGIMMPVRSSGMERLIGVVPRSVTSNDDLGFEDIRSVVEPLLGVRVETVNWFSTYRVHHRVAAKFRLGRCFLAGDAGHLHSPAGGQGMNTGIGDAVNLSWKLAQVVQGRMPAALLDTYHMERIGFARALVATTDRAFQLVVAKGAAARLFRTQIFPRLIGALTRFAGVRRAMFKTLSQVAIHYEGSALSQGRAGRVKGGHRLPWVAFPLDNFAPMSSMDWQLHVYGQAEPEVEQAATVLGLQLHMFAWSAGARKAGLARNALYLVRPDGYVAFAAAKPDARRLREFAVKIGLRARDATPSNADQTTRT